MKILEQILWEMHEKNMFLLFLSSLECNYNYLSIYHVSTTHHLSIYIAIHIHI